MKLNDACSLKGKLWPPRQHIKKQRHYFANKCPSSQSCGFSSSHVWMWELDHKVVWAQKNWCFQIVALEKTLESPLDCKEIKPINAKGYQPWIFIGRTDAVAEAPILWPPDVKSHLTGKDLELAKIEGKRRRGQKRIKWLDGIIDTRDMSVGNSRRSWEAGKAGVLQSVGHSELDTTSWWNNSNNKEQERCSPNSVLCETPSCWPLG